jgi:hypothetical protein
MFNFVIPVWAYKKRLIENIQSGHYNFGSDALLVVADDCSFMTFTR